MKRSIYKYIDKIIDNNLPLLSELPDNERIFFNVPYNMKNTAKALRCCFDKEKKLWFTGLSNSHLVVLTSFFEINQEHTSIDAFSKVEEIKKAKNDCK